MEVSSDESLTKLVVCSDVSMDVQVVAIIIIACISKEERTTLIEIRLRKNS